MLLTPTIAQAPETDPALDWRQLYALGLDHVRDLSRKRWTDYNVHDPGITTLELACYALTELAYRAQFPVPDLLADPDFTKNAAAMEAQFFRAREILPCRPLTANDYRKLLIDRVGVKNAWIVAAEPVHFVDVGKGELVYKDPGTPGTRKVALKGLYRALIELEDGKVPKPIVDDAKAVLQGNRNLCEDFIDVVVIPVVDYALCAEIELEPGAESVEIAAQIKYVVGRYLSPPVANDTLEEMLARKHRDGTPYTLPEIFEGPALDHGFIADEELEEGELRTEIRLSDVISLIMDIPGVRAVRDIVIDELGDDGLPAANAPPDKWRLEVPPESRARLGPGQGRLVFYKRGLPVPADMAAVQVRVAELEDAARAKDESKAKEDPQLPLGRFRRTGTYLSFQNHFPALYGLSQAGLDPRATPRRQALALQLKGYLLLFDQVMANYLAQLAEVRDLFSRDPAVKPTYRAQLVTSFRDAAQVYEDGLSRDDLEAKLETPAARLARRNRFLDHLLSRVGEDFHHYVSIMQSAFGAGPASQIELKCAFLSDCPRLGAERALAYNYTLTQPADLWDSGNISGLERRLARLLDIKVFTRRDLGTDPPPEGMYLIENILLRPGDAADPFLPVCVDPTCTECVEDDPYSYRLHIVLCAEAGDRFANMDFRRFVEETIRTEVPAHIAPKVCWVKREDMAKLQQAYRPWLSLRAGLPTANRAAKIQALIDALYHAKNVYEPADLNVCGADEKHPPFILGRSALGTEPSES